MILYLTGLTSLNAEQIEAARMEGAKGWTMLWHVILPQLRPDHVHGDRRDGDRRAAQFRSDLP